MPFSGINFPLEYSKMASSQVTHCLIYKQYCSGANTEKRTGGVSVHGLASVPYLGTQ